MPLEKQVVSLELAKRLKELGVKQASVHFWAQDTRDGHWELAKLVYESITPSDFFKPISAFTVAELGEMLPQTLKLKGTTYQLFVSVALDKQWFVVYANEWDYSDNAPIKFMMCHNEADARAKMLIYLIENGLLKANPTAA